MSWWLWIIVGALGLYVFFLQLWVLFLAVMNLKRVQQTTGLKPWAKFFGRQVLAIGMVYDLVGNWLCSLIFLDTPRHWLDLITGRLQAYVDSDNKLSRWRARWAWGFSDDMLNDFDPPKGHIHRGEHHG